MKGKPRNVQKRKLHETPKEFAEAAEYKIWHERWYPENWSQKWDREERREKLRNMKMPSKRPHRKVRIIGGSKNEKFYGHPGSQKSKRFSFWI